MDKEQFSGPIKTLWCDDGTDDMIILENCYFLDSKGILWTASEGRRINGASIPRIFWIIVGSPYTGNARRAAAFHDCGYEDQYHTREETDLMFLDAMLADGMDEHLAAIMYNAVRDFGGSHW